MKQQSIYMCNKIQYASGHARIQAEPNRAMTELVLFLQSLKCVGFTPHLTKLYENENQNKKQNTNARAKAEN